MGTDCKCARRIDHTAIGARLFDATVRFSTILWLAAEDPTIPSDALLAILEESTNDQLEQIFGPLPEYVIDELNINTGRNAWEFLADYLIQHNKLGLLVCAETPVRVYSEGRSVLSWGCYRQQWLYCESLEEGADKAIAWAEEQAAKDKEKSLGGAA